MNRVIVGLLSAAAVATTILLVRQQREELVEKQTRLVPAGESQPAQISLERIRELGL